MYRLNKIKTINLSIFRWLALVFINRFYYLYTDNWSRNFSDGVLVLKHGDSLYGYCFSTTDGFITTISFSMPCELRKDDVDRDIETGGEYGYLRRYLTFKSKNY